MLLDENPFHILGASTRSDRQRIMTLVEERSLFLDPDLCTRCGTDLITPRSRLQCEVAWLPGVPVDRAEAVLAALLKGGDVETLPSPLAQLNVLVTRLIKYADQPPEALTAGLLEIAAESERVNAQEIRALLNEDRRNAKFAVIDDVKDVERALADHLDAVAANLVRFLRVRRIEQWIAVITAAVAHDSKGGDAPGSRLLHVLIDSLAVDLEARLERQKTRVDAGLQKVLDAAKAKDKVSLDKAVDYLAAALHRWDQYAQPLQLSARSRGQQHESSREMAVAVRSLAIDLHNDHAAYDASWHICELLEQVFAEDPRVVELIAADKTRIGELASQRKEAEERQAVLKDMEPITAAPTLRTLNGIGTVLYGHRDNDERTGTYVATVYFVLLFFPLLPLSAYRVRKGEKGGWYFLGKVPLTSGQRRYKRLVAMAAVLLFVIWGLNSESQQNTSYNYSTYSPSPAPATSPVASRSPSFSSAQYTPPVASAGRSILYGTDLDDSHSALRAWIQSERTRINEAEAHLTTEQNRLQELDADLTRQKQLMDNYEAAATDGALPPEIYDQYKSDLRRYNNMVEEYNSALETQKWNYSTYQEALAAFKDSVAKYNGTP